MSSAIDMVDLLGQVSAAIPVVAPFQPIFGALKIVLQRAQNVSRSRGRLTLLASRSAQLCLSLNNYLTKHIDLIDDDVKDRIDGVNCILRRILSQYDQFDKQSFLRRLKKSQITEDKLADLSSQLQDSVNDLIVLLSLNTTARVESTHRLLLEANERNCGAQPKALDDVADAFSTDFRMIPRSEITLSRDLSCRRIQVGRMRDLTIMTSEGMIQTGELVIVKQFMSSSPVIAQLAFKREVGLNMDIWSACIMQPFGQSPPGSSRPFILYRTPEMQHRIGFYQLMDQWASCDEVKAVHLTLSMMDFIKQWGETMPVYPISTAGEGDGVEQFQRWVEEITFSVHNMKDTPLRPRFDGELCCLTRCKDADVLTVLFINFISRLDEKCGTPYQVRSIMRASVYSTLGRRSAIKRKLESVTTSEALSVAFNELGWSAMDNTPLITTDFTNIQVSTRFRWFYSIDRFLLVDRYWDPELRRDITSLVTWKRDHEFGYLVILDKEPGKAHKTPIRHFKFDWPGTPLDKLEFRSSFVPINREEF